MIPATIFKFLLTIMLLTPVIIYLIIIKIVDKKLPASKTAGRIAAFFMIPVIIGSLILCVSNNRIFTRNYTSVISFNGSQFQIKKYIFRGETVFNYVNGTTEIISDEAHTGDVVSPFGDGFYQTLVNNTDKILYIYGITYGGEIIKNPSSGITHAEVIKSWSYKNLLFPVDYYFKQTPPGAITASVNQYGPAYSAVAVKHWITDIPIEDFNINNN